jgi:hypothetical protein
MNRAYLGMAMGLLLVTTSCGGGGGSGPAPTPTSNATKAATVAASSEAMSAAGQGANNGFSNLAPAAMVLKEGEKSAFSGSINMTYNCQQGGTITATGTMTTDCTGSEVGPWSCTNMSAPMQLTFNDCMRSVTIDGTTSAITLAGSATSRVTGQASGTGQDIDSATFSGTFTGGPSVSGDVTGTVDLADLAFSGTVAGQVEPQITCSGTTSVTIDAATQVCAIATDCSTCTE